MIGTIFGTLKTACKGALGIELDAEIWKVLRTLGQRADPTQLPANHHLQRALERSLADALRLLAWTLYNPKRRKFSDVLCEGHYGEALTQLGEMLQNEPLDLLPATSDHWLVELLAAAVPGNFATFDFKPFLLDNHVTELVPDQINPQYSRHLHDELLKWSKTRQWTNPHRHQDFDRRVEHGWDLYAADGKTVTGHVTFYEVFCLYFREELKKGREVFNIFVVQALADLKRSLVQQGRSAEANLVPTVSFEEWKQLLEAQNAAVLSSLQKLQATADQILDATNRVEQNQHALAARIEKLLEMQSKAKQTAAARTPEEEEAARREVLEAWAKSYGLTLQVAEEVIARFIAETRADAHADAKTKADAEFLAENFLLAAQLYQDSAQAALRQLEKKETTFRQEKLRLKEMVVNDLLRAGESFYSASKFQEALAEFETALAQADPVAQAELWAKAQNWIGNAAWRLGLKTEGAEVTSSLQQAVTAYRAALEVYTRQEWPQDWAMTQNNLAIVLSDQAQRSEGVAAERLLAEAVTAYRAALEVYTRQQMPQDWAMTQNNLAATLRDQAKRSEGVAAERLLAEAVTAYRAALEVRTRQQMPQDWAATQNNLANALRDQAERSNNRDEAKKLLREAIQCYENALTVHTAKTSPYYYQIISQNLALARAELQKLETEPEK